MKCGEFETRIQSVLDCRESLGDDQTLREHADQCADCAAVLDAYNAMLDAVEIHETPELDDDFGQRVVQLTFAPQAAGSANSRYATRAMVVALASIAALIMISVLPRLWISHDPAPSPGGPTGTLQLTGPGTPSEPSTTTEDPEQIVASDPDWRSLWSQLSSRIASEDLQPIETLAEGIRPITNSLTTAVDGLRTTFPVGGVSPPPKSSEDSASLLESLGEELAV